MVLFDPPLDTTKTLQSSSSTSGDGFLRVHCWPTEEQEAEGQQHQERCVHSDQYEVWSDVEGPWSSYRFSESNLDSPVPLLQARLPLPAEPEQGSVQRFSLTYRRIERDGCITWLGTPADNVEVALCPATASLLPSDRWKSLWRAGDGIIASTSCSSSSSHNNDSVQICNVILPMPSNMSSFGAAVPLGCLNDSPASSLVLQRTSSRLWWLWPQTSEKEELHIAADHQAQLVLFQTAQHPDLVVALFPVSTHNTSTAFTGGLDCSAESNGTEHEALVKLGWSRLQHVHLLLDRVLSTPSASSSVHTIHGDSLVWCTYNSLGVTYTLHQVLAALPRLPPAVDSVLLDDGWQDASAERTLLSYDASPCWLGHDVSCCDSNACTQETLTE